MRILVLSDTHGHLKLINTLVEKHGADAVIHCGDFGLESATRLNQTPQRELTLRIRHAPPSAGLPGSAKKNCFKMSKDEKIEIIKNHNLLGDFDAFLDGSCSFKVPVYCIWGNHEDDLLVQQLVRKEVVVPNLHMVTGPEGVLLDGWIRLVGVGGNIIHWLMFDKETPQPVSIPSLPKTISLPPPISAFYPSMRFSEWARLFERFNIKNTVTTEKNKNPNKNHSEASSSESNNSKEQLWLVTHISPGKEPTLEWLMHLLHPTFVFSGHMGPYLPQHYSMFTVMDDLEWLDRVNKDLVFVRSVWEERQWSFKMWHFALDLLELKEGDTSDYRAQWTKFEEATIERQVGTKTKLTDMYFEPSLLQAINSTTTANELATKIIELFANQTPPEDSVNLPSSKKKVLLPLPNPSIIPTKEELGWITSKIEEFLVVPPELMPKEAANATDSFLRKASDVVKQSPQFFNLPDAYMGGYMFVDTNPATQTLSFTTIGTYPQSHIV